jgi:hypothetical protein
MKKITISILFVMAMAGFATAQERLLQGLSGVSVRATVFASDKTSPLSSVQLKTDVEVELRKVGIKVFDDSLADGLPNVGRLDVFIGAIPVSKGRYAFIIEVSLQEKVSMVRKPTERFVAATWSHRQMTTAETENEHQRARDGIAEITGNFARQFLTANPK